jgi:hypothetical protein
MAVTTLPSAVLRNVFGMEPRQSSIIVRLAVALHFYPIKCSQISILANHVPPSAEWQLGL